MKSNSLLLAPAILLAATAALITSCSTVTVDTTTAVQAEPGVPGGRVLHTEQINATVTAIDAAQRRVTLVTRAGEKRVVKAGPGVINFDQIQVGDQLKVTYSEEHVVRMAKPGEKVDDVLHIDGDFAPAGSKPGLSMGQTFQTAATVSDIDLRRRKVQLRFSDGSTKKMRVRDDIDLTKHKVGERVVISSTEAFAIKMTKP